MTTMNDPLDVIETANGSDEASFMIDCLSFSDMDSLMSLNTADAFLRIIETPETKRTRVPLMVVESPVMVSNDDGSLSLSFDEDDYSRSFVDVRQSTIPFTFNGTCSVVSDSVSVQPSHNIVDVAPDSTRQSRDWAKLTVKELKRELKNRRLKRSGRKEVLVSRLQEHDSMQTSKISAGSNKLHGMVHVEQEPLLIPAFDEENMEAFSVDMESLDPAMDATTEPCAAPQIPMKIILQPDFFHRIIHTLRYQQPDGKLAREADRIMQKFLNLAIPNAYEVAAKALLALLGPKTFMEVYQQAMQLPVTTEG